MPLLVNLQHLLRHSLTLRGELTAEELDLGVHDDMIQSKNPLEYTLEVEKLEDGLLVQGRLRLKFDCQCVRCLKPFPLWLDLKSWAAHLPLTGEDAVPIVNDCVDLTPQIREDILLGFPQHPVCEPECAGLSSAAGGQSEAAAVKTKALPSSAWSELDKLKL